MKADICHETIMFQDLHVRALRAVESYCDSNVQSDQKVLKTISCQVTETDKTMDNITMDCKLHWIFRFTSSTVNISKIDSESQTDKVMFETLLQNNCNGVSSVKSNGIRHPPPSSLSSQVGYTFR